MKKKLFTPEKKEDLWTAEEEAEADERRKS